MSSFVLLVGFDCHDLMCVSMSVFSGAGNILGTVVFAVRLVVLEIPRELRWLLSEEERIGRDRERAAIFDSPQVFLCMPLV